MKLLQEPNQALDAMSEVVNLVYCIYDAESFDCEELYKAGTERNLTEFLDALLCTSPRSLTHIL